MKQKKKLSGLLFVLFMIMLFAVVMMPFSLGIVIEIEGVSPEAIQEGISGIDEHVRNQIFDNLGEVKIESRELIYKTTYINDARVQAQFAKDKGLGSLTGCNYCKYDEEGLTNKGTTLTQLEKFRGMNIKAEGDGFEITDKDKTSVTHIKGFNENVKVNVGYNADSKVFTLNGWKITSDNPNNDIIIGAGWIYNNEIKIYGGSLGSNLAGNDIKFLGKGIEIRGRLSEDAYVSNSFDRGASSKNLITLRQGTEDFTYTKKEGYDEISAKKFGDGSRIETTGGDAGEKLTLISAQGTKIQRIFNKDGELTNILIKGNAKITESKTQSIIYSKDCSVCNVGLDYDTLSYKEEYNKGVPSIIISGKEQSIETPVFGLQSRAKITGGDSAIFFDKEGKAVSAYLNSKGASLEVDGKTIKTEENLLNVKFQVDKPVYEKNGPLALLFLSKDNKIDFMKIVNNNERETYFTINGNPFGAASDDHGTINPFFSEKKIPGIASIKENPDNTMDIFPETAAAPAPQPQLALKMNLKKTIDSDIQAAIKNGNLEIKYSDGAVIVYKITDVEKNGNIVLKRENGVSYEFGSDGRWRAVTDDGIHYLKKNKVGAEPTDEIGEAAESVALGKQVIISFEKTTNTPPASALEPKTFKVVGVEQPQQMTAHLQPPEMDKNTGDITIKSKDGQSTYTYQKTDTTKDGYPVYKFILNGIDKNQFYVLEGDITIARQVTQDGRKYLNPRGEETDTAADASVNPNLVRLIYGQQTTTPDASPTLTPSQLEEQIKLLKQAEKQWDAHQFDAVRESYTDFLQKYPNDPRNNLLEARLADILRLQQKYPEALEAYATVVEKYQDSEGSIISQIRMAEMATSSPGLKIAGNEQRYAAYIYPQEVLEELIRRYPSSPYVDAARFRLGERMFQQKNIPEAKRIFEEMLNLKLPDSLRSDVTKYLDNINGVKTPPPSTTATRTTTRGILSSTSKSRIPSDSDPITLSGALKTEAGTILHYDLKQVNENEIKELQNKLTEAKFKPGESDGKYGAVTQNAVRAFQIAYNEKNPGKPIPVDGEFGTKTFAALDGWEVKKDGKETQITLSETLKSAVGNTKLSGYDYVSKGEQVMELQKQLEAAKFKPGKTDGSYGPNTAEAVKSFQTAYNKENEDKQGFVPLVVDGKFGTKTFEALNGWKVPLEKIKDAVGAIRTISKTKKQ